MKKKIVFALESFFPEHNAGTEVYVLNLAKYLIEKGWKIEILISSTINKKNYSYDGIPVFTFDIPKYARPSEMNGIDSPSGLNLFIQRIKDLNPDIVHFHSFGRGINSTHLKAVKTLGIKTVFTPHLGGTFCIKGNFRLFNKSNCDGRVEPQRCLSCILQDKGFNEIGSRIMGKAITYLLKFNTGNKLPPAWHQAEFRKAELEIIQNYADLVFSIAPWIQKTFEQNGILDSKLLPQGINPSFFDDSRNKKNINSSLKFIFIGRMNDSKGFHLLKDAWDCISSDKAELHVITNHSKNNNYFTNNKNWALNKKNVYWNEGFSQQEVASYLDNMDMLILPSISNEVAPLVIFEAATRRIPAICSDYIAFKDIILPDINGLLFENGNYKDLLYQILKIIDNKQILKQLSLNVSEPFSMDKVATLIELEYFELFK